MSLDCQSQSQKPKVYIDAETKRRFIQPEFDSLSRILTVDPDKSIHLHKPQEVTNEIQIPFTVLIIKSVNSVRRNWLGRKMPEFSLQDTIGQMYDNASIAGKVVVLNLWSTTCSPCIEEIPLLNNLVRSYTTQGVVFLALTSETSIKVSEVLSKHAFAYTVLPHAQALFKTLDAPGYPYHIVIDREGYLRYIQSGTMNSKTGEKIAETELPDAIEQALK